MPETEAIQFTFTKQSMSIEGKVSKQKVVLSKEQALAMADLIKLKYKV